MKVKIGIGVAVALVVSCCGFALYRHFVAPDHHASGEKGCYSVQGASDTLVLARCAVQHDAEIVDFFYPEGVEEGCHRAAEAFLGGPLADARVAVRHLNYVRDDFSSQACALVITIDSDDSPGLHTGSLQGTMSGDRPMAIGCGRLRDGLLQYDDCSSAHNAEYVGSVVDGGDHDGSCRQAAADYLGQRAEQFAARRDLRSAWLAKPRDGGRTGCVVVTAAGDDALERSVKGLGQAAAVSR